MKIFTWWKRHRVSVLGYIAAAIPSLLAIEALIPKGQVKFWQAAAVLTGLAIARTGHTMNKPEQKK